MKVAITGNSSGIGLALDTVLSLTSRHEIRGFSKSNGHNIATDDGEEIIQTILDYDPDVLFNNAYYPKIQNKILETLYQEWANRDKIIINTGSISGYLKGILLHDDSDYVNDKKALADFCIRNSFNYPWANRCRIHCISFGFVATPLITNTKKDINKDDLIKDALKRGIKIIIGDLLILGSIKFFERAKQFFWKFKGRMCYRGDFAKDQSGAWAVYQ